MGLGFMAIQIVCQTAFGAQSTASQVLCERWAAGRASTPGAQHRAGMDRGQLVTTVFMFINLSTAGECRPSQTLPAAVLPAPPIPAARRGFCGTVSAAMPE